MLKLVKDTNLAGEGEDTQRLLSPSHVLSLFVQTHHFDGGNGTLGAFVAQATTAAVLSLLKVVGGEQTKDEWYVVLQIEFGNAMGCALTNIVEVRGISSDDTAEAYDGIGFVLTHHDSGTGNKFKTARHMHDVDVAILSAMLNESLNSPFEELVGHIAVPLRNHDAKGHLFGGRDSSGVAVGKVLKATGHWENMLDVKFLRNTTEKARAAQPKCQITLALC